MPDDFPYRELSAFISEHIRSLEMLEVLLLTKSLPLRDWEAAAVYDAIKTSIGSIEKRLKELQEKGFLVEAEGAPKRYRFEPRTPELGNLVTALDLAYKVAPVWVREMIYSPSTAALSAFARAFKIKPDKP